jgi:hypothetical protein
MKFRTKVLPMGEREIRSGMPRAEGRNAEFRTKVLLVV